MLILSRRAGESIYIGDNIRVSVLKIQGSQIKLGFEVPENVGVYREEVYNRIREQNQKALDVSNDALLKMAAMWQQTT
ncbi:carbon storage regulator CsrA [uncultured Desulfovibrio sp.]|uniref:carbon storage regulator CsrA n=1 Tax=uncultured Desulfovibrio sp. TaxID=167968 RepID=UPI001C39F098|nr:carbon storage regulator CsrA [uncultured Desulfovibrio sp.]MDM8217076.1 carbon storage regulator CsrA [Desulfovibrio piger]HIX40828.1 carbon storage regulator CsrA [Candidatus Desulfovibrio intestinigallinarum]